jgi:hypothetical protein
MVSCSCSCGVMVWCGSLVETPREKSSIEYAVNLSYSANFFRNNEWRHLFGSPVNDPGRPKNDPAAWPDKKFCDPGHRFSGHFLWPGPQPYGMHLNTFLVFCGPNCIRCIVSGRNHRPKPSAVSGRTQGLWPGYPFSTRKKASENFRGLFWWHKMQNRLPKFRTVSHRCFAV